MNFATEVPSDSQESEHSIVLKDLEKTFDNGEITAIEDINLTVDEDEFVVLVGPSGCGKTTTLRCIAGLEQPDKGEIWVENEEITWEKPKDRDLAYVFQRIALFPHKSVRENIRFGLDMKTDLSKEEKNQRVKDAAEMLGIAEMLDRKPGALSGGQQQRVSIGRAMVMEPSAFLLDEPFSALDANLRDQMRTEIKQLQRDLQTAMIFVTHDQEEAMTLGDKIVVMDDANIQQLGSPYEIYNEPNNLFVASFIGSPSTNLLDSDVETSGDDTVLTNDIFSLTVSDEQANELASVGDEQVIVGIRPEHLEVESNNPDFTAEVSVIEPHGSQDAVFMEVDGKELIAITEQNILNRGVETTGISFDADRIWIFRRSGERIV